MHCRTHFLAVAAAMSSPHATGFVRNTLVSFRSRPISYKTASSVVKSHVTAHQRRASKRPSGRTTALAMSDRITDAELDSIKLDPSTLSESEQKRLANLQAMTVKLAEVDAAKRALRESRKASSPTPAEPAAQAVPASYEGMTDDERKHAETLASIERNLAEVNEIQRQLGIDVNEEAEERDLEVIDTAWRGQAGLDISRGEGSRNWVDIANRKVLVAGDVFALVMFAYIGRASHGTGAFDLEVLTTATPFVLGWLGVSPLLGSYTNSATASMGDVPKVLLPAWGVSIPVGLLLRALSKGGEMPPIPFVVTSMIFTLVALGAWRGVYTAFNPTSTGEFKKGGILDGFRMITTLLQRW